MFLPKNFSDRGYDLPSRSRCDPRLPDRASLPPGPGAPARGRDARSFRSRRDTDTRYRSRSRSFWEAGDARRNVHACHATFFAHFPGALRFRSRGAGPRVARAPPGFFSRGGRLAGKPPLGIAPRRGNYTAKGSVYHRDAITQLSGLARKGPPERERGRRPALSGASVPSLGAVEVGVDLPRRGPRRASYQCRRLQVLQWARGRENSGPGGTGGR